MRQKLINAATVRQQYIGMIDVDLSRENVTVIIMSKFGKQTSNSSQNA